LGRTLIWAGFGTALSAVLALVLHVPDVPIDLTPWNHWRLPPESDREASASGPVLVTVEYRVSPDKAPDFVRTMRRFRNLRRRDGASRWSICRDFEVADRYLETFIVWSWAEHLRQHTRAIRADSLLEDQLQACIEGEPGVRHFLYV